MVKVFSVSAELAVVIFRVNYSGSGLVALT
jgi:hypothetical protein